MASTFLSENLVFDLNMPPATSSPWHFRQRRSQVFGGVYRRHSIRQSLLISCKGGRDVDSAGSFIDRRNVLIGLGGLYGAASGIGNDAVADPIDPPDLSECTEVDFPDTEHPTDCCPPFSGKIWDFKLPSPFTPVRQRRAAHNVVNDKEYMDKFTRAIKLMMELPKDDPRNFMQQANVHCAYCDGAYHQKGFPDVELQVHSSWLFFPFHRWYLYFFERILGKLIDDESFAIPFWNWDAPEGMKMPKIYTDQSSPLYDKLRDPAHEPPKIINLNFGGCDPIIPDEVQIFANLVTMHRQMVVNARTATRFMGCPYRAGDTEYKGAGSLEHVPHNTVHNWTGNPCEPNHEDMGIFYSAGRDPIFYAHHANVDRMWNVWKQLDHKHKDFTDSDWLDSAFLFYDEEPKLVRVKIRDCVDTTRLGYKYEDVKIPWRVVRPIPPLTGIPAGFAMKKAAEGVADNAASIFPQKLSSVVNAIVNRPPKILSRNEENEEKEELLVISPIMVQRDKFVKFDVYINVEDHNQYGPESSKFAGSFVHVPHRHKHSPNIIKTRLTLGITEVLEDLQVEDDMVVVTIVPRAGKDAVTVGGVEISNNPD